MRYKTARLDLRLYPEDKDALKRYCDKYNINMTDLIVSLIHKEIILKDKEEKEQHT